MAASKKMSNKKAAQLGFGLAVFLTANLMGLSTAEKPTSRQIHVDSESIHKLMEESRTAEAAGNFNLAQSILTRAWDLLGEAAHRFPEEAAKIQGQLGGVYLKLNQLDRAESSLQKARKITTEAFGPHALVLAQISTNLGDLNCRIGRLNECRQLFLEAREIFRKNEPTDSPESITLLENIATVLYLQGDYITAIDNFDETMKFHEKNSGPKCLEMLKSLNMLGLTYKELSQYELAESFFQRAITISKNFPQKQFLAINPVRNLANLYRIQKKYRASLELHAEALKLSREKYGESNPMTIFGTIMLSETLIDIKEYDAAQKLLLYAFEFYAKNRGYYENQISYPLSLLGRISYLTGDWSNAARRLKLALINFRKHHVKFDKFQLDMLTALANLGTTHNDYKSAQRLITRIIELHEHQLRSQGIFLSEKKLTELIESYTIWQESVFTMALAAKSNQSPAQTGWLDKLALSTSLLYKGRIEREMNNLVINLHKLLSEEDKEAVSQLSRLRARYSSLTLKASGSQATERHHQAITMLEQNIARLEERIIKRTARLRGRDTLPGPTAILDRVAEHLPKSSALLEYAIYRPDHQDQDSQRRAPGAHYVGLLLMRDKFTLAVDLGDIEQIDGLLVEYHKLLSNKLDGFEQIGSKIYRKLILPFDNLFNKYRIEKITIAAEGSMFLVPFDTLIHNGVRLGERFGISYANSGRDLLKRTSRRAQSGAVVVFSDPDFNLPHKTLPLITAPLAENRGSRGLNITYLSPLPGTRKEAESIAHLIPSARIYQGEFATEDAIASLQSPSILHIATHGLFVDASAAGSTLRSRSHFIVEAEPLSNHPLLLSALAMAGATAHHSAHAEALDLSDGILTALELADVNLAGTQMVILSACNSGRGLIKRGQGVYGLRRAVFIAGAETLVTSLWKVDDDTTQLLMSAFYTHLRAGEGRADALRHAQQEVQRAYPHPYYWASFILIGQTEPLRGIPFRPPGE